MLSLMAKKVYDLNLDNPSFRNTVNLELVLKAAGL